MRIIIFIKTTKNAIEENNQNKLFSQSPINNKLPKIQFFQHCQKIIKN